MKWPNERAGGKGGIASLFHSGERQQVRRT
jgi:hypothetical protein